MDSTMANHQILPVDLIDPHPMNPRHSDRSERFAAIVASMKMHGFWEHKPLVVRPVGNGRYEAVGGCTRHAAAIVAAITEVPCYVKEMTDEEAIIQIAEDNLADPFNWAEQCIYIAQNADKGSKLGLSRARLVQACTGKTGDAAVAIATKSGQAGELIVQMMEEQNVHLNVLLNSKKDLNRHLYEICALPDYRDREYLVGRLLSESLTIDQIKMIVDDVRRSRTEAPTWTTEVTAPNIEPVAPSRHMPPESEGRYSPAPERQHEAVSPPVLRLAPPIVPQKSAEPTPIDILRMDSDWSRDRIRMLEEMIFQLFDHFGSEIPQPIAERAMRMGVFEYRFREMQNAAG